MKITERIALLRAGYTKAEIEAMVKAENEDTTSETDEETKDEAAEADDSAQEGHEADSSADEAEADGDDHPNFEELYKKAKADLEKAQAENVRRSGEIERQKQTISEYLDKAFEEIFE